MIYELGTGLILQHWMMFMKITLMATIMLVVEFFASGCSSVTCNVNLRTQTQE